jgi:hypothetical protein
MRGRDNESVSAWIENFVAARDAGLRFQTGGRADRQYNVAAEFPELNMRCILSICY